MCPFLKFLFNLLQYCFCFILFIFFSVLFFFFFSLSPLLFLFYILVIWPPHMWDLSSPSKDQTPNPCIETWSLKVLTIRPPGKSLGHRFEFHVLASCTYVARRTPECLDLWTIIWSGIPWGSLPTTLLQWYQVPWIPDVSTSRNPFMKVKQSTAHQGWR